MTRPAVPTASTVVLLSCCARPKMLLLLADLCCTLSQEATWLSSKSNLDLLHTASNKKIVAQRAVKCKNLCAVLMYSVA